MNRNPHGNKARTLAETQSVLKNAMENLGTFLDSLTKEEKEKTLSNFYAGVLELTFDFHLETMKKAAKGKIAAAGTYEAKAQALRDFKIKTEDMAWVYQIGS